MAETTPGPLIMVTQFVGFMGAYRASGPAQSAARRYARRPAHHLGHLRTVLSLDFPRARPYGDAASNKALSAALAAITAAVVGVILNLAVWFALHVLFGELREVHGFGMTVDIPVLQLDQCPFAVLTLGAMLAVFRFKVGMIPVLAACSVLGVLYGFMTGVV